MSFWISLLNNISVSFFGGILSASFCDDLTTRKKRRGFWCSMVLFPLLLVLYFLTGKLLWPFFSILSAYLCCELRRWIALLAVAIFSGNQMMQEVIELVLTLPLLLILLRFASPVVRQLSGYPAKVQCQFGLIPALYYAFDYVTCVYTKLLFSGDPVVVEFMPFVCCVAYLVFLLYHSAKEQKQSQLQQVQKSLDLQLNQAVQEINTLRESQILARRYRHDMRHHLQYLSACIENGQEEQAQAYISGICNEIEAQKVQNYCENEAANLILSSFAVRAEKDGIGMKVRGGGHCRNVFRYQTAICVCFFLTRWKMPSTPVSPLSPQEKHVTWMCSSTRGTVSFFYRWQIPATNRFTLKREFLCQTGKGTESVCRVSVPLWNGMVASITFWWKTETSFYNCRFETLPDVDSIHFLYDSCRNLPLQNVKTYNENKSDGYISAAREVLLQK